MRKLQINRETIRTLTDVELVWVAGARPPQSGDCHDPIPRPTECIQVTCQGYTHMPCPETVTCTTVTNTC